MRKDGLFIILGIAAVGIALYFLLKSKATTPISYNGLTPAYNPQGANFVPTGATVANGFSPTPTVNPTSIAIAAGGNFFSTIGNLFKTSPVSAPAVGPIGIGSGAPVASYSTTPLLDQSGIGPSDHYGDPSQEDYA